MSKEKAKPELLPGGVTQAQIDKWKREHPDGVYQIQVPMDENSNQATGYFKKPDMAVISAASKYATSDPIKTGEILFDSCWLGGDPELQNVPELKVSAFSKLKDLFRVREAAIKKL